MRFPIDEKPFVVDGWRRFSGITIAEDANGINVGSDELVEKANKMNEAITGYGNEIARLGLIIEEQKEEIATLKEEQEKTDEIPAQKV
jgi:hypothetical protein